MGYAGHVVCFAARVTDWHVAVVLIRVVSKTICVPADLTGALLVYHVVAAAFDWGAVWVRVVARFGKVWESPFFYVRGSPFNEVLHLVEPPGFLGGVVAVALVGRGGRDDHAPP